MASFVNEPGLQIKSRLEEMWSYEQLLEDHGYTPSVRVLSVETEPAGPAVAEDLAIATGDRLHQPARQVLFPSMSNIFRAALSAGALGVFLSGAGSSVLALTRGRELTIGYEMADAASKSNVAGDIKVASPTTRGVHLV